MTGCRPPRRWSTAVPSTCSPATGWPSSPCSSSPEPRRDTRASGYARTFVQQMEQVMGACLDRGIKVVSNAGGLDPEGAPTPCYEVARAPRPRPDDRLCRRRRPAAPPRRSWSPAASGWTTSKPASRSATPPASSRPTPTSGAGASSMPCAGAPTSWSRGGRPTPLWYARPAAWHHGWQRHDWDALAGAVVAGHVIECGTQATGGNYSFFTEVPGMARTGFPWAEIAIRRIERDRQARRHRGRGFHRDGHFAAAVRDRLASVPRPRCHGPLRHHRARAGRP